VGRLTRYLGAAALTALFAAAQTDRALAVPFDIDCGGWADVDTSSPTLVGCTAGPVGAITDLTVFLEIDDPDGTPYASDLEIILMDDSAGTSVVLYSGSPAFSPDAYMNATFDDAAAVLAPTSGDVIGTYLPVEALSAFDGLELSGDWTLSLQDLSSWPGEGLDLISWRLVGNQVPEPSTLLLFVSGLTGLAISGRSSRA
jgi:hypothetical protein